MTQYSIAAKTERYLRKCTLTLSWQLAGCQDCGFDAAIVIPALDEVGSLPKALLSLETNPPEYLSRTLIVVVVNNRFSTLQTQKAQNQQTLLWLQARSDSQLNLAWVDAASAGCELPEKDGVGLARKIGFDLALERLCWAGEPLLVSLDADSLVDANYLPGIFKHFQSSSCGAAYLPFRHQSGESPAQESAIRRYELYLRSYQFGLNWAGSPYAHISIGSALACRADAYVAAGGMKRRQAGEDFYFLQQLAKVGGVNALAGTLVSPEARYSERVPFGTGRAIEAAVEQNNCLYRFISYATFQQLKDWLALVNQAQAQTAVQVLEEAEKISPELKAFLMATDFCSIWQKLQNQSEGRQFISAWHRWFDGLKTRQLLTCLELKRETPDPKSLVAELLVAGGYPNSNRCSEQLKLLESLQGVSES